MSDRMSGDVLKRAVVSWN